MVVVKFFRARVQFEEEKKKIQSTRITILAPSREVATAKTNKKE